MYKLSKRALNKNFKKKSNKLMQGGSECENYNAKYVKYNKIYNEESKKIRDLKSNIEEMESIINENTNDKFNNALNMVIVLLLIAYFTKICCKKKVSLR